MVMGLVMGLSGLAMGQEIDFLPLYVESPYRLNILVHTGASDKPEVIRMESTGRVSPEITRDTVFDSVTRYCPAVKEGKYGIVTLTGTVRFEFASPNLAPEFLPTTKDRLAKDEKKK